MKKKIFLALFVVLMCLPLSATWAAGKYNPKVAAHRGASGYLPEHTLEAKAMAYALGADYVEQDVVMTKDNVLVVLHDHTLETTTDVAKKFPRRARKDGSYYAIDFTLAELKKLNVTERFDAKTGQAVFPGRFPVSFDIDFKIPTFEEELLLVAGLNKSTGWNVGVYVEIKEPEFHERNGKDIVKLTIDTLTKYGYNVEGSNCILQIFDYPAVKKSRAIGWKGDLAMLVSKEEPQYLVADFKAEEKLHEWLMTEEGIKDVAQYANIYAPWFGYIVMDDGKGGHVLDPSIKWARQAGMKLHTWTYRADQLPAYLPTEAKFLDCLFKEIKVDGLFTDFTYNVVQYLKKNKLR